MQPNSGDAALSRKRCTDFGWPNRTHQAEPTREWDQIRNLWSNHVKGLKNPRSWTTAFSVKNAISPKKLELEDHGFPQIHSRDVASAQAMPENKRHNAAQADLQSLKTPAEATKAAGEPAAHWAHDTAQSKKCMRYYQAASAAKATCR